MLARRAEGNLDGKPMDSEQWGKTAMRFWLLLLASGYGIHNTLTVPTHAFAFPQYTHSFHATLLAIPLSR
eukprot:scaffold210098_cov22-Tisochrysis_lutea.AAC.1